jgi:hypothetical protein
MSKHPMQRVKFDDKGVIRFQENRIIVDLFVQGILDLNKIAMNPAYDADDRMQLAQLLGYSVSGYGDLSYTTSKSVRKADKRAEKLRREQKP